MWAMARPKGHAKKKKGTIKRLTLLYRSGLAAERTGKNKISHPDIVSRSIAEAKSVTPTEKDSLYKAFAQLKQQNKKRGEKG